MSIITVEKQQSRLISLRGGRTSSSKQKDNAMRLIESATASLVALGAQILVVSTLFI
jgi:hypothetical protein